MGRNAYETGIGHVCPACKTFKKPDEFSFSNRAKNLQQTYCKPCLKVACKKYNDKPESKKLRRKWDLFNKYGLSLDDFDNLLKLQNYKCAICLDVLNTNNFYKCHVDHDHQTQIVRGILCATCNVALGGFKDSKELLERAIKYLVVK